MSINKKDEIILAVEREKLFESEKLAFQGGQKGEEQNKRIFQNISQHFVSGRRGDLEEDQSFKQPIPYVVIKRQEEYFVCERLEGGGEARLHGKLSIGAGGHMNPIEGIDSFDALFVENMKRELKEELSFSNNEYVIRTIGLINDDTNGAGRVHIGLVGLIEVKEGTEVNVLETDKLRGFWATREQLSSNDYSERLETWSKIALELTK